MKMKKLLSVILAAAMLLSVFIVAPFSVGALTKHTYGDWEYEIWSFYDNKTYETHEEICITNYTGDGEKVSIPNEIDGKPVTYMYNNNVYGNVDSSKQNERHFMNHDKMVELTIPENLKYIAGYMLMDCTALHDINVSSNNKYFEFKNGVLYMKNGTQSWGDHTGYHKEDIPDEYGPVFARFNAGVVNLPAYNTTIYAYAFYNHSKLQNVTMNPAAGKMRKIEDYAFCSSGIRGEEDIFGYTAVSIPYGVASIGYSSFQGCKDLHTIHFPETLKKIDHQAFLDSGCVSFHLPDSLEEVGYQAFGYSGHKVNIFGSTRVKQLVEEVTHYESFDEQNPPAGAAGAIMITHDPSKPFDHIYMSSATVPPTCTTPGLTTYICTCGFRYYSSDTVIQPLGHNYETKTVYSTCTEQGYTLHTCKNCGDTYKDNYRKLSSHWKVNIPAVEPTATAAGRTAGQYCDVCGAVFTQSTLIPPTGYTEKEDKGVKVTAEPEASPKVTEVKDEATIESLNLDDDKEAEKVYDIKLEKNGQTVQPEGDVIVKIPCGDEKAEVFHQEADGTLTNMNAYNDTEGNKVFKTDSFSLFVIAKHVPEKYKLWVNGEQLAEDKLTVQCGEGTAAYDPKENTLTLDNAQITKGTDQDYSQAGVLSGIDDLKIVVKGECSISETRGYGVGCSRDYEDDQLIPHNITVIGDGKLTIKMDNAYYGYGYGFFCTGKLRLEGVDVDITSIQYGVSAVEQLIVKDSKLKVSCSAQRYGIAVKNGSAAFDNSKVYIESAKGDGIQLGDDNNPSAMLVSSGSVTVKGKVGINSDVEHSAVSVSGGKLIIEAQDAALGEVFLTDVDQHILLGEGVEILSGALDGKAVTIGAPEEPKKLGDADGSGNVDMIDATVIQRAVCRIAVPYDEDTLMLGDVDSSGELEITDATFIQRFSTMVATPYPIGEFI